MSLTKCSECGKMLSSKRHGRKHYREEHAGEIETPEEYLPSTESEQRDFHGDTPDTSEHNPEYLTDPSDGSDDGRKSSLFEFERENDDSLEEYTEDESE